MAHIKFLIDACGVQQLVRLSRLGGYNRSILEQAITNPAYVFQLGDTNFDAAVNRTITDPRVNRTSEGVSAAAREVMEVSSGAVAHLFGLNVAAVESMESARKLLKAGYAVGLWQQLWNSETSCLKSFFDQQRKNLKMGEKGGEADGQTQEDADNSGSRADARAVWPAFGDTSILRESMSDPGIFEGVYNELEGSCMHMLAVGKYTDPDSNDSLENGGCWEMKESYGGNNNFFGWVKLTEKFVNAVRKRAEGELPRDKIFDKIYLVYHDSEADEIKKTIGGDVPTPIADLLMDDVVRNLHFNNAYERVTKRDVAFHNRPKQHGGPVVL